MPEMRRRFGIRQAASSTLALLTCPLLAAPASAQTAMTEMLSLRTHEWAALALHVGIVAAAVILGVAFLRTKRRAQAADEDQRREMSELLLRLDRAEALAAFDPQVIVVWNNSTPDPQVLGGAKYLSTVCGDRPLLAFGAWLDGPTAQAMDAAVAALRERGEPFRMDVKTQMGGAVEVVGRPISGQAVLRLRSVTGLGEELADLKNQHQALQRDAATMTALLSAVAPPVWLRDKDDKIVWANAAFARAVGVENPSDAARQNIEFLDANVRASAQDSRRNGQPFARRITATAGGQRKVFDLVDLPLAEGSGAIAVDVSEAEAVRHELEIERAAHKRLFDQLDTPVAIFDSRRLLVFYNSAFRQLWDLPAAFLDGNPSDDEVLDRLREQGRLPVETDFRGWKAKLHDIYSSHALEPREILWHLPDNRMLRVVQNPDETGGLTYVYDDVTERYAMKGQMETLTRVQRETLDNIDEGVAMFGSNGKLRLHNSAFQTLWALTDDFLAEAPHVEAVVKSCAVKAPGHALWTQAVSAVAGLNEKRVPLTGTIERSDGVIVHMGTVPLPDGGSLVTFRNVTNDYRIQRALADRNEALEATSRIKSDFVENVSYQMRTPLTSIIGFAQVLDDPAFGALDDRQKSYLGYIMKSSASLLQLVNDILDLASIDAGVMGLDMATVDVRAAMNAAAEALKDRLMANDVNVMLRVQGGITTFTADEQRVRQILFNLLANAVAYSPAGGTVTLSAAKQDERVLFRVEDQGPGIPEDMRERVFDRFEANRGHSKHRGAGLGLSLVRSFVELHHGYVAIASRPEGGTVVTVSLPSDHAATRSAAE